MSEAFVSVVLFLDWLSKYNALFVCKCNGAAYVLYIAGKKIKS